MLVGRVHDGPPNLGPAAKEASGVDADPYRPG